MRKFALLSMAVVLCGLAGVRGRADDWKPGFLDRIQMWLQTSPGGPGLPPEWEPLVYPHWEHWDAFSGGGSVLYIHGKINLPSPPEANSVWRTRIVSVKHNGVDASPWRGTDFMVPWNGETLGGAWMNKMTLSYMPAGTIGLELGEYEIVVAAEITCPSAGGQWYEVKRMTVWFAWW